MKLTPHNIIHHELIGLDTEVADSTNSSFIGQKGRTIDETKNIIKLQTDEKEKNIPKSCSSFIFTIPSFDGKRYLPLKIKVDGRLLLAQPENRIQTKFKKKFRK
ncbi:MAG: ribonuclease P protein component 1 [Candidatus Methanoperedens sp.]|nr:ribonuclease P protein component 1 [Candidatus Methanoperedens sp.]MCE8424716.1 ribonuclease P protein component 1 [Candidatus Methanoperedens sp.]MCE8427154.1 ribonuclease P protein component 1 [Candidatus Methanoperedens sp.]